ncbi:hypothetical protein [Streptomyces longwoodensis]|uniref:hypothetical protein n=1 Tax=Streptomyces longwoodensis TaxID=68231 RepID=UPI0033C635B1
MNHPSRPRLKSITTTPTDPRDAEPAPTPAAVGEPNGAARKGVVTALRSNRYRATDVRPSADPTRERPGIRIFAPPVYRDHWDGARWSKRHGTTPTAAYACVCGQAATATGADDVAALANEYAAHKHFCTGTPATPTDGRNAA